MFSGAGDTCPQIDTPSAAAASIISISLTLASGEVAEWNMQAAAMVRPVCLPSSAR